MTRVVHLHRLPTAPCGEPVVPFLPRSSVTEEVTCAECRKAICQACKATGLNLARPLNPGGSYNHCKVCRGSGLMNW